MGLTAEAVSHDMKCGDHGDFDDGPRLLPPVVLLATGELPPGAGMVRPRVIARRAAPSYLTSSLEIGAPEVEIKVERYFHFPGTRRISSRYCVSVRESSLDRAENIQH